jgi:hypothetical protein
MSNRKTIVMFGRRGPSPHGSVRMLGAEPTAPEPPPEPCSVTAWYEDPPLDAKTGKPTDGMKTSTMAYLLMGIPALVGAAIGAVSWKTHRVAGGGIGAVAGFAAGVGVTAYQYSQWKAAGGSKHTKGACDAPAAGKAGSTEPSSSPAAAAQRSGILPAY